jgi:hypothetical protein
VKRTAKILQYYACDDSSRTLITLPADKVHLVVREGSVQRKIEREQRELAEEEHRLNISRSYISYVGGILVLVCVVLSFFLSGTFLLLGAAAALVALLNGWSASRRLRGKPEYEKAYRRTRQGMLFAGIGIGLIAALLYLASSAQ